jgi:hypothetical protein
MLSGIRFSLLFAIAFVVAPAEEHARGVTTSVAAA